MDSVPPTRLVFGRFGLFADDAIFDFFLTGAAHAIEVERVVRDFKIQQLAHHVFDLLHTRIAKFYHFPAVGADDVVVLFETIGFFVLRKVAAKLVLFHQIEIDQKFQRVVHRSATDAVAAVFHVDIKCLRVEVVVALVNFLQNGKPFRGFPEAAFFQLGGKNIEHLLDEFLLVALG